MKVMGIMDKYMKLSKFISLVLRHKPEVIGIKLDIEPTQILLQIKDNGVGFIPEKLSQSYDGIGIRTMRSHITRRSGTATGKIKVLRRTQFVIKPQRT